jgi:hypothetical protein
MPEFTIITTTTTVTVTGDRWARTDAGVFVYPEDGGDAADPVAEVDADEFVAIYAGAPDAADTLPHTITD